jgi:hypothetical protein
MYKLTIPAGQIIAGESAPFKGPHGVVYFSTEAYNLPTNNPNFLPGTYVHELGNILDIRNGGDGYAHGDPNPQTNQGDPDTGAKLERCVFGTMQKP